MPLNFFFFISLFLIFIFIKFFSYYSLSFFNYVTFIFWFSLDFIDYYFTFSLWLMFIFFTTFLNSLYSYFFISHVISKKKNLNPIAPSSTPSFFKLSYEIDTTFLSKKDFKLFLYNWLKSTSSLNKNKLIFSLFNSSPLINNNFFFFYHNLYKTIYYLNLFDLKTNNLAKNNYLNFLISSSSNSTFFLFLILKKSPSYFNSLVETHSYYYKLNTRYILNSFNCNSINSSKFSNNINFFISKINLKTLNFYAYLFNETTPLLSNYQFFLKNTKSQRWLYRYSIIHRKTFKNSHKLTNFKKILNSGLVNSHLTNKNIWNSEIFNKFNKNNLFHYFSNLSYFSFFKNESNFLKLSSRTNFLYTENLSNLKFIEESFFWNIKRFFFFNSLHSNSIFTTQNFFLTSPSQYFFNENLLLKNFFFLNQSFINTNSNYLNIEKEDFFSNSFLTFSNILSLSTSEELFNFEDLELANNILSSSTITNSNQLNLTYFNYFNNYILNFNKSKFIKKFYHFNFFYYNVHNFFYLKDLNLWLNFYNK